MATKDTIRRRRREVAQLMAEDVGLRETARRLGSGVTTIRRDREWIAQHPDAFQTANAGQFAEGNDAGVVHGAHGEASIQPAAERYADVCMALYPGMDDVQRNLLATELARIELGHRWLDGRGKVVKDAKGNVYDVADRLSTWGSNARRAIADYYASQGGASPGALGAAQLDLSLLTVDEVRQLRDLVRKATPEPGALEAVAGTATEEPPEADVVEPAAELVAGQDS